MVVLSTACNFDKEEGNIYVLIIEIKTVIFSKETIVFVFLNKYINNNQIENLSL